LRRSLLAINLDLGSAREMIRAQILGLPMIEPDQLQKAIEGLHRCSARWVRSVLVKETREGDAVWEGVVHVFDLEGHATASRVYAWSSPIEGTPDQRRFFAVMHQPPVTSPAAAVRASIAAE
jgi:hypothetical protein